jgi:hypothetical protein
MPFMRRLRSGRPHVQLDVHTGNPGTEAAAGVLARQPGNKPLPSGSKPSIIPDGSGYCPGELLSRHQLPGGPGDVLGVDTGPGQQLRGRPRPWHLPHRELGQAQVQLPALEQAVGERPPGPGLVYSGRR